MAARCATEAFSTICAVHMRAGGCLAVVAQWQSTAGSSQRGTKANSIKSSSCISSLVWHMEGLGAHHSVNVITIGYQVVESCLHMLKI